jgi:hypothetical protein
LRYILFFALAVGCVKENAGFNGVNGSTGGGTTGGTTGSTTGGTTGSTTGGTTGSTTGGTTGSTTGGTTGSTTGGTTGSTTGGTTGGIGVGGGCTAPDCVQVSCAGTPTTITGHVKAPNGFEPVAGAMVYVPSLIDALPDGTACESCTVAPLAGNAIVFTRTASDGSFTLSNAPSGTSVPIVIQKGHFRRMFTRRVQACQQNSLTDDQGRLPRIKSEGDLPHIAVGIGDYDQIECVLHSTGVDTSEFTAAGGGGAVELYENGQPTAGGHTDFEALLHDGAKMRTYQMIFINCTGNTWDTLSNQDDIKANIFAFLSAGGRLYVSDWAYDYIEQVPQLAPFIFFAGGGASPSPQPVHVAASASDTNSFTASTGQSSLTNWISAAGVGALTIQDLLASWVLMVSVGGTGFPVTTWLHGVTNGADRPITVSFNVGCGKTLFSSFHAREPGGADPLGGGTAFPGYCKSTTSTMIAQEKVLEFLLLEIADCQ